MLLKRFFTAAGAIPVLVAVIVWGGELAFLVLVLLVTGLGLHEFFAAALPDENLGARALGIVLGLLIICSVFLDARLALENVYPAYLLSIGSCAVSLIVIFFYYVLTTHQTAKAFNQIVIKTFGIFYISLFLCFFILVRSLAGGPFLILFLLFVTWAGDSGAYFIGSWKGKHALCPRISPKKTVEGAVGSFGLGIITAFFCKLLFLQDISLVSCLVLGAGINLLNQFGDLSESLIKRAFGIKQSGTILPGHGGMLDRIDSLLFAVPFLFYFASITF